MNRAVIVGRICVEPTLRPMRNGGFSMEFEVETSTEEISRNGEPYQLIERHRAVLNNRLIARYADRVQMGAQVSIEGALSWHHGCARIRARDLNFDLRQQPVVQGRPDAVVDPAAIVPAESLSIPATPGYSGVFSGPAFVTGAFASPASKIRTS